MKSKTLRKRLFLKKMTIAHLSPLTMKTAQGGILINTRCTTETLEETCNLEFPNRVIQLDLIPIYMRRSENTC